VTPTHDPFGKYADLRKRAQAFLTQKKESGQETSFKDVRSLIHELDTYQIELELQNEDLRQAQEELEESRQKYSDLYDFAPVGYLTISNKGLISEANLTAADMLSTDRRYLLKQPLSAFIVHDNQDIFYLNRKKLLETVDAHFRDQEDSDEVAAMDSFYQRAYSLISSPDARAAFDLSKEPQKLRDAYGRGTAGW